MSGFGAPVPDVRASTIRPAHHRDLSATPATTPRSCDQDHSHVTARADPGSRSMIWSRTVSRRAQWWAYRRSGPWGPGRMAMAIMMLAHATGELVRVVLTRPGSRIRTCSIKSTALAIPSFLTCHGEPGTFSATWSPTVKTGFKCRQRVLENYGDPAPRIFCRSDSGMVSRSAVVQDAPRR